MNYYTLEYPYFLLLLLALLWCFYKCREKIPTLYFVHLHLMQAKRGFKNRDIIIKIAIFILLTLALASPIIIDKSNPLNRFGKDIILAMDASGSMNASGFDSDNIVSKGERLSRFELSKRVAKEFILKRESDNIGVVLYGDFAFIASPITYEKEIVVEMLEYLTQGMAGQNTAIGEAIAMSLRAFAYSKAQSKIVVLLSDGEHNSGAISPKDALTLAKEQGVKIYTIAITQESEKGRGVLQKIAKESGGEFYTALSARELQAIYTQIDALESSKISSKEYKHKSYYYQSLLLLALSLLLFLLFRELRR